MKKPKMPKAIYVAKASSMYVVTLPDGSRSLVLADYASGVSLSRKLGIAAARRLGESLMSRPQKMTEPIEAGPCYKLNPGEIQTPEIFRAWGAFLRNLKIRGPLR